MYSAAGAPVIDRSGRQQFRPSGEIVRDSKGAPVLGGVPEIRRTPIATRVVRGVSFPTGKPVKVGDAIALKLRCMGGFDEVGGEEVEAPPSKMIGNLGKSGLIKLATKLGIVVDKGASQRDLAELIRASLDDSDEDEVTETGDLAELGVRELRDLARNEGIQIPAGTDKAGIIELIEKAKATKEEVA